ncbi:MAG: gliding motility-associated C-terminal domain-containing protein [Candidatus Latescibacteria bacterium]|nr:gliding motility-associated C-terminal domain-containing protein [Candidatus Latescibacterota bacterium]
MKPHLTRTVLACWFWAAFLFSLRPAVAIDTLAVGQGVRAMGWRNLANWGNVQQLTVTFDSVFRWDTQANTNLGPGIPLREGSIIGRYVVEDTVEISGPIPGLERLVDGDPGTAFNPDQAGVPRDLTVIIDLGAAFRVDRLRLFPRLDPDHRLLFPQIFSVSTQTGQEPEGVGTYRSIAPLIFQSTLPNREPAVDRQFESREVRYLKIAMDPVRPWELAEVEIYSDGSVPLGVYESVPIPARHTYPVWGRVWYEGGALSQLPIVMQTRTGPDRNPIQYFRRTGVGDELEAVAAGTYTSIPLEERGPVRSNPGWSAWTTVTDAVRSPSLRRFIQFRILFPEPGIVLRKLFFEYAQPPVVQELEAEIDPWQARPGEEQLFTLSVVVHMLSDQRTGLVGSTGFRQLQVLTGAEVSGVEQVLVDDRPMPHTAILRPGEGFTVNLGRRIDQDGSFLQVAFRGAVFRDATHFEVRAVDRRVVEGRLEEVSQSAVAADVEPDSPGGELVVRLDGAQEGLLAHLAAAPLFTPNGDAVNDEWILTYDLLKLTRPARVRVGIYDLAGIRQREVYAGEEGDGRHRLIWDGTDETGRPVAPGLYLYRVEVEADQGRQSRLGWVGVGY